MPTSYRYIICVIMVLIIMSRYERTATTEHVENIASSEKHLPASVDVVIVGGGLSGKALASRLSPGISVAVIDSRRQSGAKEAMYLVTSSIADRWGISANERARRNLVTSCVWYAPSGEIAEELRTTGKNEGFAITPQNAMERAVSIDSHKLFYDTEFQGAEDMQEGRIVVHTSQGNIQGNLVIDATGWEAHVVQDYYGSDDYMMDAVYGGNYRTRGFDRRTMSFIRGLPYNNKNWVMPISDQGAEVVVSQQIPRSQADTWWNEHSETQFDEMVNFYGKKGKTIVNTKQGKRMGFRLEPAKRKFYKGRVIPFGESGGLNSPIIGQLIDVLPLYADRMAGLINDAKMDGSWDKVGRRFYRKFITDAPYSYLLHSVMRDNSVRLINGYPSINRNLSDAMKTVFPEDQLWSTLRDNGLSAKDLVKIARAQPLQLAEFAMHSVPSLLSLLIKNPELYLQFALGIAGSALRKGQSETEIYRA